MKKRIAIIGGGIVGRIMALELDASKYEVFLVDVPADPRIPKFLRDLDAPQSLFTPGSRILGSPGGELVWGSNVNMAIILPDLRWPESFIANLQNYANRLTRYGFPNVKVRFPSLGTTTAEQEFTVTNGVSLKQLSWTYKKAVVSGKIFEIRNLVSKVQIKDPYPGIVLEYTEDSQVTTEKYFDKIILCAGSLGNQEILAQSGYISELPKRVYDHMSFLVSQCELPKLKIARKTMHGFQRYRLQTSKPVHTFLDSTNNILWSVRYFANGLLDFKSALKLIKATFLQTRYISAIRLLTVLLIGTLFGRPLHSSIKVEASLDFITGSGLIPVSYSENNRIDSLTIDQGDIQLPVELAAAILTKLNSYGVTHPKEFIKRRTVNDLMSASHLMGTTPVCNSRSGLVTESFALRPNPNVLVAGASVFPASILGHPTMMAAATAVHIASGLNREKNVAL